jgi:cysteinyl-tRNA synthetase
MGFFDGIIDAAASFIGGGQANQKNWDIAQANNAFSAAEAQKNRDWQEEMRKTQYQTAVGDLKAAGLNPMLAYTQGGAGTPSGATASATGNPKMENNIGSAADAFFAAQNTTADTMLKNSQQDVNSAQAEVGRTQALKNIADEAKSNQDTETSKATQHVQMKQLENIAAEIALKKAQQNQASAQGAKALVEAENARKINPNASTAGRFMDYLFDKGKSLEDKAKAVQKKYYPSKYQHKE